MTFFFERRPPGSRPMWQFVAEYRLPESDVMLRTEKPIFAREMLEALEKKGRARQWNEA